MSSQQNQPDSIWTMIWAIIVGGVGCAIFWHYFQHPILETMRYMRLGEISLVGVFTSDQDACIHWLHNARYQDTNPSEDMIRWTNQCFGSAWLSQLPAKDNPSYFTLTGSALSEIEGKITYYYHWILCGLFILIAGYVVFFSPRSKFRTKHNLESFIKIQAKMWPVINPIVNFNPIKSSARIPGSEIPDKLPLFAEALSPEEWLSFHRIPVNNRVADREATRRAFLLQLGPRWNRTIDGQPLYLQALFAAYSLKGVQRREESDDLLGEISLGWSAKAGFRMEGKLEGKIHKVNRDADVGGKGLEIANLYAYRTTAMLGVLRWARSMGGVLAPAQFLWLRGTDRPLWYALNNLGRRSFHTEGAGAMAHFMVEDIAKKPLPIPRIDTAMATMNIYLAQTGQPVPPREGDPTPEKS